MGKRLQIDRALLNKDELREFDRIREAVPSEAKRAVRQTQVWGWGLWVAGVIVGVVYVMVADTERLALIPIILMPPLLGVPWVWIWLINDARVVAVQQRLLREYLWDVGYYDRASKERLRWSAAAASVDSFSPHFYTNGYQPERWFSYSKSERDYMRETGMDADIYDSNVRDHDPS